MGTDANDDDGQAREARAACERAGLSPDQIWFRYFSNGGDAGSYEIDAYLNGSYALPRIERDLLAHSINELIDELPPRPRAPYSRHLREKQPRQSGASDEAGGAPPPG